MAFTDRFLQIPIQLYDTRDAELTGKKAFEKGHIGYLLPMDISEFFGTTHETGDPCTMIYTKSGRSLVADYPVKEFMRILNKHQQLP